MKIIMKYSVALFVLLITSLCQSEISSSTTTTTTSPSDIPASDGSNVIRLLVMLPLSNNISQPQEGVQDWDKGLEILPGAQLAVEQINNSSSLLPGYTLELLIVDIEHCHPDEFTSNVKAVTSIADIAADTVHGNGSNVLGLVGGPFCPPLLDSLVSPLASRDRISLFQISGSTAATIRNHDLNLIFAAPSIEVYYEAVFAMMGEFDWTRIFIVAESFFQGAGTVKGSEGLDITFRQFSVSTSLVLSDLRKSMKNIIFASLSAKHAADILCSAYRDSLIFPTYVWIFHDLTPTKILEITRPKWCNNTTLEKALRGTFFLQFPFKPASVDTILPSGDSYSQYYSDYVSRLRTDTHSDLQPNPYANVLYDSVWTFAKTLNLSMTSGNCSGGFHNCLRQYGKRELVESMDLMIPAVSFEGASGSIDYQINSSVRGVVQISLYNGSIQPIGTYHQFPTNISIQETLIPRDDLPRVFNPVPKLLVAFLGVVVTVCLVLTTIILALFIHYRNDSDIKAASPRLSYFMFVGCYLLFGSTLLHTISKGFRIDVNGVGAVTLCGVVITGDSLGVNLIFTTLLLRMLRVYRIFSYFGKTGKIWSDKFMLLIIVLVVVGDMVLIIIWSVVDTYRITEITMFMENANPPYYTVKQLCHSQNVNTWLGILLGKLGVLFVIVLFLAFKTRKILRSNFKDTKKVNIYIFLTVMIVITLMSLYSLFKTTENTVGTFLMVYFAFGTTGLLCQLFLFVPKVFSPIIKQHGYEVTYNTETRRRSIKKIEEPPPKKVFGTFIRTLHSPEHTPTLV